ncbi:MAG: substrate-binding domain-containing protein [Spirochaetia bacterium]
MWTSSFLIIALLLGSLAERAVAGPKTVQSGTITVSGAFALYPIMVTWSEAYQKENPSIRIDVSAGGAGKGMADVLGNLADLGMVSREVSPEEKNRGAWAIAVTKDAVVAIASARNPQSAMLAERGLSRNKAKAVWLSGAIKTWGHLTGTSDTKAIHVYTRSDACGAADVWAQYIGARQEDLLGTGVFGDPGIVEAVKNDPLGIGYGNLNFVYDASSKRPVDGLMVIPLDQDNSDSISASEQFYASRDDLTKAIADRRYPSPPARELYLVTHGVPKQEIVKQFLMWILSAEGQKYVVPSGYIVLPEARLREQLKELQQ